jgi:hypothetical protein
MPVKKIGASGRSFHQTKLAELCSLIKSLEDGCRGL